MGYNQETRRNYYRSSKGLCTYFWGQLRKNSRERNHGDLPFSKEDLRIWLNQNNLDYLILQWEKSGWCPNSKPSIDRLDSNIGYNFSNMRLITWGENNIAAYTERKTRRSTKQAIPIQQLDETGSIIAEYISIAQAARDNSFCRTNINMCINGKAQFAHGYRWRRKPND